MARTATTNVRERLVTRTIITTAFKCMVVTPENQVSEELVTLGNMNGVSDEKIEKILKSKTENIFVRINSREEIETLMGMSESDFIRYAHVIER